MTRVCVCVLVTVFTAFCPGLARAGDAAAVVNRFIEVSGGLKELENIEQMSFTADMAGYGYTYDAVMDAGGRYWFKDSNQTLGFDGTDYWLNYRGIVDKMPDSQVENYSDLTLYRYFFHGLIQGNGEIVPLEYVTREEKHGKVYDLLKTPAGESPERTYYFDSATGLLEKIMEIVPRPGQEPSRQLSRYSGYTQIGKIKLYTQTEASELASGTALRPLTVIQNIKINPGVSLETFKRPESTMTPATVRNGEIQAKVVNASAYGSIITNITHDVMQEESVRAHRYDVLIKGHTSQHLFMEPVNPAAIQPGQYLLLFNNTPVLWVVKAYEGMVSEVQVEEGDLVYLTPIRDDSGESVQEHAETPPEMQPDTPPQTAAQAAPPPPQKVAPAPLPDATRIMAYRDLGNTGLKISDISLGAGALSDPMVIEYALDKGINYFDTAESYGGGSSEKAIGMVAARRRPEMIICTKLLLDGNTKKADVIQRLGESLQRLQTDYVDILMIHGGNRDAVDNPEIYAAFDQLKKDGKIRFSGVSSHGPAMTQALRPVVDHRKVDVMLLSYDPVSYPDLPQLLKDAEDKGIGLVAMKTFSSARAAQLDEVITGKYPFNIAALRWVLRDPYIDTAIPSAMFVDHVDEYIRVSGYSGSQEPEAGNRTGAGDGMPVASAEPSDSPDPLLAGLGRELVLSGEIQRFPQDEMWRQINGADQQYIGYGCRSLTVAQYLGPDGKDALSVEIYAMPDHACGFGIYASQKPGAGPVLNIGGEGYSAGSILNFYKGPYYVKLTAPDDSRASADRLKTSARAIAAAIDSPDGPPEEFRVFNGKEFDPDSFEYIHDGILGIKGLGHGFSAKKTISNSIVTVFYIPTGSSQAAAKLLDTFTKSYKQLGETELEIFRNDAFHGVFGSIKYKGPVCITAMDSNVFIVTGLDDKDQVTSLIQILVED